MKPFVMLSGNEASNRLFATAQSDKYTLFELKAGKMPIMQKEAIEKSINEWIGTNEQVDDITVWGIKI